MSVTISTTSDFEAAFDRYPADARKRMEELRALIRETAEQTPEVTRMAECLKWGEPSFVTNAGSTLRMDWKPRAPEQFALYFKCTSLLVPTFKTVYHTTFTYEGNRAIAFGLEDQLPTEALKACIQAALRYHKVKQLPSLGI